MDILISPLVNMLLLLYGALGNSFVLAIIIATIVIRLITLPLTLPQQRNSRKMAELAPQLEELKKKHGNDRNKFAQAQMELYKENKVNMFGGCLPLILQLVIMIAFYQALTGSLACRLFGEKAGLLAAGLSLLLVLTPPWLPRRLLLLAGWSATAIVATFGPAACWGFFSGLAEGDIETGGMATWVFGVVM